MMRRLPGGGGNVTTCCVTMMYLPPMLTNPPRANVEGFGATWSTTEPSPVVVDTDAIVIQDASEVAVHGQLDCVVTLRVVVPPVFGTTGFGGVTVYVHGAAA